MNICVIVTNPNLHIIPLPGLSFYASALIGVLVWTKLISFDLQPQIHKNYNGAYIKIMHRVMLKYSHVLRA